MDLTASIAAKSDQWNAEDLIAAPVTVTIDRVSAGSAEQPVDVHLVETPGKAYRPSKSMRRILVAAWGADTSVYPGRRITLYREPSIKFGAEAVGGIRLSHLSHIDKPLKIALTVTRGKREAFTVQPLADTAPVIPTATPEQLREVVALLKARGITEAADCLAFISDHVHRPIASSKDLNRAEASALIGELGGGA